MSLDSNKSVVRRFFEELWNQRKPEVAAEILATNCVTHQLKSGSEDVAVPRPPEAMKSHVSEWIAAFPDLQYTVDQMVAEDDRVVTYCTARGTHLGPWHGIPPSGKTIAMQAMVVHRIVDGLIAEDWVLVDFLGVFQQLGIVRPTNELLAAVNHASVAADQVPSPPHGDVHAIRTLAEHWQAAIRAKDLTLLLTFITDDAVFLAPKSPPIRGKQEVESLYRVVFATYSIEQEFSYQEIRVIGDYAVAWGIDSVTLTPTDGGDPVKGRGHGMSILRRQSDGSWRFARGINNISQESHSAGSLI
jgi:uncharacterized protein (TIGR02246 family)/steroid delta-isomerase-like uncharacterized protein